MNTTDTTVTLTAAEQSAVDDWCASMRDLHNVYGRPINEGDPRLDELRNTRRDTTENLTPQELGDLYWWRADIDLPAWPLNVPSWSGPVRYYRHNYPEIGVEFIGRDWAEQTGVDGTCRVGQIVTVFVDDYRDERDGEAFPAGAALTRPATVYVRVEGEVTAEQAVAFGEALVNAGRELADSL